MNSNWGRSDPSDPPQGVATSWGYSGAYRQWQKISQCKRPSDMYVFIDEHPNTINDAFFVCQFSGVPNYGDPTAGSWGDVPAFYHNRACGFGFADGHSEVHRWQTREIHVVPAPGTWPKMGESLTNDKRDAAWYNSHTFEK